MVLFIYIKLFLCYYNHIKKRVCKSNLIGGEMGIFTKYNLFDSFDDYGKNEVLEAISSLSEEEQNEIHMNIEKMLTLAAESSQLSGWDDALSKLVSRTVLHYEQTVLSEEALESVAGGVKVTAQEMEEKGGKE